MGSFNLQRIGLHSDRLAHTSDAQLTRDLSALSRIQVDVLNLPCLKSISFNDDRAVATGERLNRIESGAVRGEVPGDACATADDAHAGFRKDRSTMTIMIPEIAPLSALWENAANGRVSISANSNNCCDETNWNGRSDCIAAEQIVNLLQQVGGSGSERAEAIFARGPACSFFYLGLNDGGASLVCVPHVLSGVEDRTKLSVPPWRVSDSGRNVFVLARPLTSRR